MNNRMCQLAAGVLFLALPPLLCAADLSRYRSFQLETPLPAVVKQASLRAADVKVIHARPALLQDLTWEPRLTANSTAGLSDPVESVLLSFYNGELYRIAVNYDRQRVEGLTVQDMVDALSVRYGTATYPATEMVFPSFLNETVKVLAQWEDTRYSYRLVRTSFPPVFGVVGVSKRLASLAQTATIEAVRVEEQEAPARESAARDQKDQEKHQRDEKVRPGNKATFRP